MNSLLDYKELIDLEESTLFQFFGKDVIQKRQDEDSAFYLCDGFVVSVCRCWDGLLFSCDLSSCYNKDSQNPINFCVEVDKPMSRRKQDRIFKALNYLKANKNIAGTFWSYLPSFEDLGQEVRHQFLYKK